MLLDLILWCAFGAIFFVVFAKIFPKVSDKQVAIITVISGPIIWVALVGWMNRRRSRNARHS